MASDPDQDERERKRRLRELQERTRLALAEGFGRVDQLEPVTKAEQLEAWIERETARYGGRLLDLDE